VVFPCPTNTKRVHASPSHHLQTFCHVLSQQGSIFATVPRRQFHMLPLLPAPCTEGTAKITLRLYRCCPSGEVRAMELCKWTWAPGKAQAVTFLLVEKAASSFTMGSLGPWWLAFCFSGSWVGVWVFNTTPTVLQAA